MATLSGDVKDIIGGIASSEKGRFVTIPGITADVPTVVIFFMAAFDNLGNRYFWINNNATFDGAPVPSGSYVSASLVIEGRVQQ